MSLSASLVVNRNASFKLDVEIEVLPGQTVALLGPNGAGKSTTVAALAGITPIDQGRIVLGGRILEDPALGVLVPAEDRQVGVVFQDYLLFPHLSVIDNVAFGLRSRGVRQPQALSRAGEWLERLELGSLADSKPARLSGGQAQRVALARALITDPQLLLLDEPLSALDVGTRSHLRRTLAEHLREFAGPRLLITHDPAEAFLLADFICILENGTISQAGKGDEIRMRPRSAYAADLAGLNLFRGVAETGIVTLEGGHHIAVGDLSVKGPVLITIHPRAVALYRTVPEGSPRNTWPTTITLIERLGDRARVQVGAPVPLTAEVTSAAIAALRLVEGVDIWVAFKATEVGVAEDDEAAPEG